MNESGIRTLEQVRQFLDGKPQVSFLPQGEDAERYSHINEVLRRFGYAALGKSDRGLILRDLQTTSGYSRAQITRLVARALKRAARGAQLVAQRGGFHRRRSRLRAREAIGFRCR